MKKDSKRKKSLSPLKIESDIAVLMNKMQQQLISLEQKIDTLSNRLPENPFKEKHFSKPFDRFNRYSTKKQSDISKKRNFTNAVCAGCNKECEIPFKPNGNRPVYCKECFSKRKGGNSFKEKYARKSRGGENRSSEKKKKSIFQRRKKRI
jgi:CxxC-x17-CxxC domain-containing protein